MTTLRIWLILVLTLIRRKIKVISLALFIFTLLLSLFIFTFSFTMNRSTVSEGIIGTYTAENLPEVVTSLLSRHLIRVDAQGNFVGDLVESWKEDSEAKTFTFVLRDNIYWSDGSAIKAGDLDLPEPNVNSVKVLDDKTFQYSLQDSYSPFPLLLDKPIFKKGKSKGVLGIQLGTGPYRVKEANKDQIFVKKITLEPIDKTNKNNTLPKVIMRFYQNEGIAKDALKLGEVESLIGVSDVGEFAQTVSSESPFTVSSATNFQQLVTIFYNTKDEALAEESFRLALSYAAPSIPGEQEATTSIPPTSWAFNKDVRDFLNNPTQAKHELGKSKNKDKTITLTATSSLKNVGEMVVNSWNSQGVKAVLRVESGIPQNFQALLITQKIPADPDQYSLWHSTQSQTNISGFSSPRVDKDLEDGRKVADQKVRVQRYQDFQRVLLDHAPATFLYFPKKNIVYISKIEPELKKVLELQSTDI